uniref:Sigma-70 family RNA polymerase sigma factor n=1 Tax=Cyanothece sp. (strain PCC 7425 / ATCC 29141) TaxID=395961 RepID=B8HUE5_CYAP4
MDSFDQELKKLIAETCSHPVGSLERQRGLNRLVAMIQSSGKLSRTANIPDYEDALQQTWFYFCRNLCEATTGSAYDPDQAHVITWLNAYLKHRLLDKRLEVQSTKVIYIQRQMAENDELYDPVENLPAPAPVPPLLEDIQTWLQQEYKELRRIHIRDRPEANCYILILRRLPPETSWEKLSQEFGIPIATLSNFYQRECRPRLKQFIISQGYFDL